MKDRQAISTTDMVVGRTYYDTPNDNGIPCRLTSKTQSILVMQTLEECLDYAIRSDGTIHFPATNDHWYIPNTDEQ